MPTSASRRERCGGLFRNISAMMRKSFFRPSAGRGACPLPVSWRTPGLRFFTSGGVLAAWFLGGGRHRREIDPDRAGCLGDVRRFRLFQGLSGRGLSPGRDVRQERFPGIDELHLGDQHKPEDASSVSSIVCRDGPSSVFVWLLCLYLEVLLNPVDSVSGRLGRFRHVGMESPAAAAAGKSPWNMPDFSFSVRRTGGVSSIISFSRPPSWLRTSSFSPFISRRFSAAGWTGAGAGWRSAARP